MREVAWHQGDVVRKLRHAADWTLKQLADESGVELSVIHDLEAGRTKEPKRATTERLAAAFGLKTRELEDLIPKTMVRLDVPINKDLGERQAPAKKGRHARAKSA